MKKPLLACLLLAMYAPLAQAQFTGPTARGAEMRVADAAVARVDTYVTLVGTIRSHLRGDYYVFGDASGEIRVEIESEVWNGRQIGPAQTVRLLGEVDRNAAGTPYVWVKSLTVVP